MVLTSSKATYTWLKVAEGGLLFQRPARYHRRAISHMATRCRHDTMSGLSAAAKEKGGVGQGQVCVFQSRLCSEGPEWAAVLLLLLLLLISGTFNGMFSHRDPQGLPPCSLQYLGSAPLDNGWPINNHDLTRSSCK